jgi:hypothetical protein
MQEGFFSWDLGIENLIMRRDFLGGQFLPFLDLCKGFFNGKKAHICQISADVLAICSRKIMITNCQISAIRFEAGSQ